MLDDLDRKMRQLEGDIARPSSVGEGLCKTAANKAVEEVRLDDLDRKMRQLEGGIARLSSGAEGHRKAAANKAAEELRLVDLDYKMWQLAGNIARLSSDIEDHRKSAANKAVEELRLVDLDRKMRQLEGDMARLSSDTECHRETAANKAAEISTRLSALEQHQEEVKQQRAEDVARMATMQQTIDYLTAQVNVVSTLQDLLKGGGNLGGTVNLAPVRQKIKVPKPEAYYGAQHAEELEDFIFDFDRYFEAVGSMEEAQKIDIAACYLMGDAKRWWRLKYKDIKAGKDTLDTWEELKAAIREQFSPEMKYKASRKSRGNLSEKK